MNTCYVPGTTLAHGEISQVILFSLFKIGGRMLRKGGGCRHTNGKLYYILYYIL